ncbi:MAG: metalloprotease TldD, partial [Deltaproteobacteria bacterium]|nr:metalloprotease TldD [Deltaproteobacteria bacterium]
MSDPAVGFFRERFGLDDRSVEEGLGTALARPVDHADLFFEYAVEDSVVLEESMVKSGTRHLDQGLGVRVQHGERQGYAHADEITLESVQLAATTARAISEGNAPERSIAIAGPGAPASDLYPVAIPPTEVPVGEKVDLLSEIDTYARARDPRVKQVMASVTSQYRHVLVAASDGTFVGDVRPLVRLNVQVIAADGERREMGFEGMG